MTIQAHDYLQRLGLPSHLGDLSAKALADLHEAHVARVPFETLDRPTSVDVGYSLERIVGDRRGGVCYHLNGAFHWLLTELGYDATLCPAATQSRFAPTPSAPNGTHIVIIVAGLPSDESPEGRWLVDVGAGEGFHRPLPLVTGTYDRGEFTYRVRRSDLDASWWRFDHDRRESCRGVEFSEDPVDIADFADTYAAMADTDMSIFFKYGWVKAHHQHGYDELLGCRLSRVSTAGRDSTTVTDEAEYFKVLQDVFEIELHHLDDAARHRLWARVFQSWTEDGFMSEWTSARSTRSA